MNFMLPKRRFGKEEQKMKSRFSIYFSTVRSPNRVLTTLKSASFEIRILSLPNIRRQLVPFFSTISILNISTKVSTWIRLGVDINRQFYAFQKTTHSRMVVPSAEFRTNSQDDNSMSPSATCNYGMCDLDFENDVVCSSAWITKLHLS
jgi:hypothetical protein